jgi:hypothetical protein
MTGFCEDGALRAEIVSCLMLIHMYYVFCLGFTGGFTHHRNRGNSGDLARSQAR